jgi:hypothetical protein
MKGEWFVEFIEERKRVGIGEINGEEQKRGCPT